MAAIIPSVASFGFRLGRTIISILAASQVLDIISNGAPSEQVVNRIAERTGETFSPAQITTAAKAAGGEYVIVHTPSNTIVLKLSRSRVFRLLTVKRRHRHETKTIVLSAGGHKDINTPHVEVIR